MKHSILYLIVLLSFACTERELSKSESDIQLSSPNGFSIASSLEDLRLQINPTVFELVGGEVSYSIKKINYLESESEVAAFIDFEYVNGEKKNIALLFGYQNVNARLSAVGCTYTASCSGTCGCTIQGAIQAGKVTFECTCSPCNLTLKENCPDN